MKLLHPLVPSAFLSVAALFFFHAPHRTCAQSDLPLPLPSPQGAPQGSLLELQKAAPRPAPFFSLPAPLPLPPEPSPFPSFPPLAPEANPQELDLRKRLNTSLIPEGPNPTEDAALQLRDRVRYRDLKTRALTDPEVRSSLEALGKAGSDSQLRNAWRHHYSLLFARLRALDKSSGKSLELLIAEREREALLPLTEKLTRPTAGRQSL